MASGEVVEAKAIVIRDNDGMVRAELTIDDRQNVVLFLNDQHGNRSISMGVTPDGRPALGLTNSETKGQITLSFTPIHTGGLTIYDAELNPRVHIYTNADGSPTVELRDSNNKTTFKTP